MAARMFSQRAGNPGGYVRGWNCASEKGLSSLTLGRLREPGEAEMGEELRGALAGQG